ncbi:MAG: hypothetical protein KA069_01910 [Candidatus Saccharimonas sp.]|nr:hypothetical protein [Candidatus Saccharimonas sp.]
MTDETRITIKSDSPVAISSSALGANINALGFNIDLILSKNPNLAIEIMSLYEKAKNTHADDPAQSDEDFKLALKRLSDLIS